MNIILLTHQREVTKKTNTGVLVTDVLGENATVVIWERKKPDPQLIRLIETGNAALLYPTEDSQVVSDTCDFQSYIVIDSTWQEAQKIYNKSSYLQELPKVKIETTTQSIYQLRRNQRPNGLCTAESIIELLKVKGASTTAAELQGKLSQFVGKK
ncbi:MAG: tRNA-uridine aminocarboxypropyltransferase [Parashewanella sp.]